MEITATVEIVLSPDDVKNIIQQFLIKKGHAVDNVYFDVKEEPTGYGQSESYNVVFKGTKAVCKQKLEG